MMNLRSRVLTIAVTALIITTPVGAAYVDLRLPSDSTGGGTLAVRVTYPESPEEFRYGASSGAPVVVLSPGGFTPGSLDLTSPAAYTIEGIIVLTFLFPGGGPPGIGSDGIYDERGDTSQRALRDVLRFATGELSDSFDRTLSQIVGGNARADLTGILALSNGGSIAITTLGRYGDEISPLAFLVSWESPTNDQVLGVELGTHDLDPDPSVDFNGDGVFDNDVINGAYIGYGFPQLDVDYDRMKYAPDATLFVRGQPEATGLFFFDNDGDGVLTLSDPTTGTTDTNNNGALDPDEDFPLAGVSHTSESGGDHYQMLSRAATAYAQAAGLSDPWPSHYATAAQSATYWSIRDATELFPAAMLHQPTIAGMSLFNTRDHVQTTTDHAHIHHYVDGFLGAGHWHRLNPDRVYIEDVDHHAFPAAKDNDANLAPRPEDFQGLAEPEDLIPHTVLVVAGLAEMADRANGGVWDDNLDAPIDGPPQPERETHWVTFAINCHDWVNPTESADTIEFILDTLEEFGARGDFYVTSPVVAAWEAEAPELIERLRNSDHTISYHVRAPHPVAFSATRDQLETVALADFEIFEQDLSTGELDRSRPGGYSYVSQVFGRRPHSTGLASDNADLGERFARITAAHGARVAVFDHGPVSGITGYENLALPEQGMYARPNDYFVARVDEDGYPGDGNFWWNRIADELLSVLDLTTAFRDGYLNNEPSSPNEPDFAVVVIHENNFYMSGTPWKPVYYEDPDATIPKPAPWDLNATASWVTSRSADENQRIQTAFRALVEAATLSDDTAIVTSEDVSVLADSLFTPASELQQDVQWLQAGGFEKQPPEGYDWIEGQPTGSNWGGSFFLTKDAADAGDLGMRLSANPGATYSIERRVDINKGETYRFGGNLRATEVGSVVLSLQPVEWVNDVLVPLGRRFISPPLTGSFNWTPTEGAAPLTGNHDFVMLNIRIDGGGTLDIDNVFVESTEASAMAFPAAVAKPTMIGALIHIEDVAALTWDSDYFRAKIQVLDDLAEIFHRHEAVLTIQPEMELLDGLNEFEPNFIRHLRTDYGCAFSVHTHGPKGPNPSIEEVLDYVRERKETLENMGTGNIHDLNGNFDMPDYSVFSSIGITSMTAFKNTTTQAGYDGRYFHPWRPSPGNPYTDEAAWAIDNPASRVVYLPGDNATITRYADWVAMKALPGLSAALWNCDSEKPTTWYFVTHVDFFASKNGLPLAEYMQSAAYSQDLAAYDDLLSDIMDPLLQREFIEWASPNQMREAFEEYAGSRTEYGGTRKPTGRVSP